MSPAEILNPTLYADRTVQDWHRATFTRDAWAIDLDLVGACRVCRTPLYLLESTTNPEKPVTILAQLAHMSGVPAFTILHRDGQIVRAQQIGMGASGRRDGEQAVKSLLALIRWAHTAKEHPRHEPLLRELARDLERDL